MNILITGAAGYVGSTLTPYLLSRGYHIRVLDNLSHSGEGLLSVWSHPHLEIVPGDIRDESLCLQALQDIDAVIHLAAIVGEPACKVDPDLAMDVNHVAAVRLAQDAKQMKVPLFLFASTASVYGSVPQGELCTEESERVPLGIYAQAKIDAEDGIKRMTSLGYYLPLILRFGTAYGISQRMRFDTLINQFARDAIVDRHLLIYQADAMRPYCHVRDIAFAIDHLLGWANAVIRRGFPRGSMPTTFNVGGHNRSKRDIAEWLRERVEGMEVEYVEKPDQDLRDYAVDWANGNMARLGWAPTKSPEDGLEEVGKAIEMGAFVDTGEGRWRNV